MVKMFDILNVHYFTSQISWFEKLNFYDVRFQRYNDQKIRVSLACFLFSLRNYFNSGISIVTAVQNLWN